MNLIHYGLFALVVSANAAEQHAPVVFEVRDQGARGDGRTVDTSAIQLAIDACARAGGGRVSFSEGRYLSGTIRLRDGVELHLAEKARLVGLGDVEAYAGFESPAWSSRRWNRGLLVGEGLHDIAITGQGVVDGNKVFDPRGEEQMRGPHTVMLLNCRNVVLRDVTIRDSANYALLFYGSESVRVENATFEGGWDGVHFRGADADGGTKWNRDVRISGCKFHTGDDCVAGHYIENAVVEDCMMNSSCNGVRLIGPAKRLTFRRCQFLGPGKFEHRTSRDLHRTNMLAAILLQPSAWGPTPGALEEVIVRDVTAQNVACALHVSIRPGNTGNGITVERLKATGVYGPAVSVESWAEQPLGEVLLRDINVAYAPQAFTDPRVKGPPSRDPTIRRPGTDVFARRLPAWGFYGRNVRDLRLERLQFTTVDPLEARPVVRIDNVRQLALARIHCPDMAASGTGIELNGVQAVERSESPQMPDAPRLPETPE